MLTDFLVQLTQERHSDVYALVKVAELELLRVMAWSKSSFPKRPPQKGNLSGMGAAGGIWCCSNQIPHRGGARISQK